MKRIKSPAIPARAFLVAIGVLFLFATAARAATSGFLSGDPLSRLSTIPHDEVLAGQIDRSGIANIAVRHEGWNETLYSWARLKLYELTGRTQIHGQDPVYSVLSLMYEPDRWTDAKFLPVEHPRVAQVLQLNTNWVSPREIMQNEHLRELESALQEVQAHKEEYETLVRHINAAHQIVAIDANRPGIYETIVPSGVNAEEVRRLVENEEARGQAHEKRLQLRDVVASEKPFLKAGTVLVNRVVLAFELPSEFLIIPDSESPTVEWIAAPPRGGRHTILPVAVGASMPGRVDLASAAASLNAALAQAFQSSDGKEVGGAVASFLRTAGESRHYPELSSLHLNNFYVRHNPARKAAYAYAVAVILFGCFVFFRARSWRIAGTTMLVAGLTLHTLDLALRVGLTGHMPVSNMYESIVFAAWSAMVIGSAGELWKRKGILGLFAAAIGTLALIGVSLMPLHETRIHPLRAVLNSYWLNIHVTMMLISYGAFAVSSLFALGYLIKSLTKREALFGKSPIMPMEQMEEFAYRLVQVGWPILTVGVCLGAIWADTAWGRFWGWDPKETWAFITWIVYTIYLHTRMVAGWKGRISAIACLIGFLMVLITWIGVSYIPWFAGGLHTYASPT